MDDAARKHIDDHLEETIDELKRLATQPSVRAQRLGVRECGEMVGTPSHGEAGFD